MYKESLQVMMKQKSRVQISETESSENPVSD